MPRNLRIVHEGMGWPVGAVIPTTALDKGGLDHLKLGAVEWTALPVTHPVEPPAKVESAGPVDEKAVAPLVAQIRDLQGKLAGAEDRAQKAELKAEELKEENAGLWKQLEEVTAQADAKAAAERQKQLDGGLGVG